MANTVAIISEEEPTRKRNQRILFTTESNYYMQKIEELANEKLATFRNIELREEQNKRNKANPCSTSVHANNKNKKRKITKKSVRPQVVVNEVTERLKEFIVNEKKGTDVKLVIQKKLFVSDTKKVLNRLNMPLNQLEKDEFLTEDEKKILSKGNEIEVRLVGPTLEVYKDPMNLRLWHMATSDNYVLTTNWYRFRSKNKLCLKRNSTVQVWSFRGLDEKLSFAVVCVEEPEVEVYDSDS